MKRFFLLGCSFWKKYSVIIVGIILTILGGMMLGIVGALTTFFVSMLIKRIKKDSTLEGLIENPFQHGPQYNDTNTMPDEPFEGALLVAALGVYCTGSAEFSGLQMQKRFSAYYSADWISLCRIASHSESLNGDLIVECLGATLLKNAKNNNQYDSLLLSIFTFLSIVEYEWNNERGEKPSVYLAQLVQKPKLAHVSSHEELEQAYLLLGLTIGSSFDEVKNAHRTLASMYHPDTLLALSEEQKKIAAEAFLRIQAAYESIIDTL